jgi:diketogulonate reductase-like aldo/keto reductase
MLDCAHFYHNQKLVGEALKKIFETKKRDDIFIVSKVWWDQVDDVEGACRKTLEDLGIE